MTAEEAARRDKKDLAVWRKARGILKGKLNMDPLVYQKRVRHGWDGHTSNQIPAIWDKVFGMMKGKRKLDPGKVQRQMRKGAGKRLARQMKLGRAKHASRH